MNLLKISNLSQMNDIIKTGNPVLMYFSAKDCSVCQVLKAKIKESIAQNFAKIKIYEIKSDENLNIASALGVFSTPSIIIYFDKKEFKRYGRNMSVYEMIRDIKRPYILMYGQDL